MTSESSITKTQVVIVGAGPTGLSLAAQLIRYGIDFIIIEKNERTTHLSKAVVVQARTLEIFQEIGIAETAIKRGRITTAMNIYHNGSKRAMLDLEGMGDGQSAFPFVLSLEQSKTETLLAEFLAEHEKKIYWNTEFIGYKEQDGIDVSYKDATGATQYIHANFIVGCDGAHSVLRQQIGSSFEGDTIPKIFYVADVRLSSNVINKDQLFIFLIKKGFVLFFPMEGATHYRVIGILPGETEKEGLAFEEIVTSIKEQIKIQISFDKVEWFSSYKVHSRKADMFMNGKAFIAGDAAHIHTPAGGQGMNTGIQDAYNLAWKLAYTIKYNLDNSILETYNSERMENAKHLLQTTDRMFDFMAGTTVVGNFFRLRIFPLIAGLVSRKRSLNKRFFPLLSQIGISYPHSILTIESNIGKVKAGDRMPFLIFSSGKNIFEFIATPTFKLLYFGNAAGEKEDEVPFNKTEIIVQHLFTEIPGKVFENENDFYILLRPDNHISYIGKDKNTCEDFLKAMFGQT